MRSPDSRPEILIVDDQQDVLDALKLLMKGAGYSAQTVRSPHLGLQILKERSVDLVLIDLNYTRDTTSGKEGFEFLEQIQAIDSALPVVVMTAWGTIETAVEAMRRGARDFVQKPWENERLLAILKNQLELGRALRQQKTLEAENQMLKGGDKDAFIAESRAMQPILEIISRVGPSDANVLVTGENGTGKGVVARALHQISPRSSRPLVTVNIGGLSEGVFESELFGHVRGAFTDAKADRIGRFEMADGGTLFLDEIANITMTQQNKLLRVLETGEFERVGSSRTYRADVRLVSATNADLPAEVAAGRFRQDLFFRLNTIEVHLPALRERKEDLGPLASFFLRRHAVHYRKELDGIDPAALRVLMDHAWPGNVRELDHVIERGVLMARNRQLCAEDLGLRSVNRGTADIDEMSLEEVERYLIRRTLARCEGNALKAAEVLGLSRSAFYRRLEKFGL